LNALPGIKPLDAIIEWIDQIQTHFLANGVAMDIMQIIFSRRSIRKYQEREVEKEKLELLLKAAMAAPTACNNQPWEFVVVTEKERMDQFRKSMPFGKHNAPAAIVVCTNPTIGKSPACGNFWVQDCSAAVENILIAAVGLGLGTVWLGTYPIRLIMSTVSKIVGLPRLMKPLAVIYVGYPAEEKEARTQYEERRVHWQKY
jgi:nitroreductase